MDKRIAAIGRLRNQISNFARLVQPLYQQLNWTWYDEKIPPTVAQIEEHLEEKITWAEKEAEKRAEGDSDSGGLCIKWDEESARLAFVFEIEEWL